MLLFFYLDRFPKKVVGAEFVLNRCRSVRGHCAKRLLLEVEFEECPRAIEADVGRQLLSVLVSGHCRPMHSDDIADFLADWQIVKFVREKDDGNEVGDA